MELRWFAPEEHVADLMKWASRLGKELPKIYHVLDAFGASQKVCNVWQAQGLAGIAYDIKLAAGHDMTAEVGVKEFLRLGLQLSGGIQILYIYMYM